MTLRGVRPRLAAWGVLVLLAATTPAWAQSGTASVTGTVTDSSGAALPGVTVTVTNPSTGLVRTATTTETGVYQVLALPPGTYSIKAELQNFTPSEKTNVPLQVDLPARVDLALGIGTVTEDVQVTAEVSALNTTDASLGNVITGNQVRQLPLEARSVTSLLGLQPGAVYVPNVAATDSRSGAVNGARADQSNVTLDGVDVNDPQFNTAFSTGLRITLDSLQEFKVSTSNYGADSGRSSAAQITLVTRSGSNEFHGSGTYLERDTRFSSEEYFLKLAGQPKAVLDKKIGAGAFGGPLMKNKLFFFGNYERLNESSQSPVTRDIPSMTMRDGVLVYPCADPGECPGGTVSGVSDSHEIPAGYYGLTPGQLAQLDPLGIGPSAAALDVFKQYPVPNDPGIDGYNLVGFRFASPIENRFNTYFGRFDYHASNNQSFFGRLNFQDDSIVTEQQFPGEAPNRTRKVKSKGFALGWDAVLSSNKVNTFRYGLTQIKSDTLGLKAQTQVRFRNIDRLEYADSGSNSSYTSGRDVPTHTFIDDFSWIKGSHTLKFGTNVRISRIGSYTNANSFNDPIANASWVSGVGRTYMPGGACDACGLFPAVADGGQATYGDTFIPLLGIISEVDGYYNYDRNGNVLAEGDPVRRKFASNEFEWYAQDSWKMGQDFTLTAGLRYSLYSPPYEVNGLQVAPSIKLGDWFEQRRQLMLQGRSTSDAERITFDLAGPANNKPGYYDWDKNNFAPRVAGAWTPHYDSGVLGWLTGNGKMVVRGGYSLLYDRIGQALATNFDQGGSFGLSTVLNSPFGQYNEDDPTIRFQGVDVVPPSLPAAPPGGFPQTPPEQAGVITEALDGTIRTPYHHSFNVVVGRELGHGFAFEAAYVGRKGRNLLVRRDAAQPADITVGGVDYYSAAQQLLTAAKGIPRNADPDAYLNISPIPFWENLFPDAAGLAAYPDGTLIEVPGMTATQAMALAFNSVNPDFITALYNADEYCYPACSRLGSYAFFTPQYDTLAVQSTLGRANYNALQLSIRKRWSDGYQFDVNYTLSKSKDHGSQVEQSSTYTSYGPGGYTGFLLDSWNPDKNYGISDFDTTHQVNVNWIAELPFGRGRHFGADMPGWANALAGEWGVSGVFRVSSGFPFSVLNCRQCWTTNWDLQSNAELAVPGVLPETRTVKNKIDGYPSVWADPEQAINAFRRAYPGEVGLRNVFRGDGYYAIDLRINKAWSMPYAHDHKVLFFWDIFNLTNTPKFDVNLTEMFPDRSATFGRYDGTLATCDGGAGRCMQFTVRYEF